MLQLEIHLNGVVRESASAEISEYFIDLKEYEHVFGQGYEGFIYSIVINQNSTSGNDIDVAPSCTEYDCETCPESTCLSHCTHLEYVVPDTRACASCEENCITGCIRGTDCRNCDNELCQSCTEYKNCETCLPSSIEVDDVCVCPEDEIFSHEHDICRECHDFCDICAYGTLDCITCEDGYYINQDIQCSQCVDECDLCTDGTNTTCDMCSDGFWRLPETLQCEPNCPSALEQDIELRQCLKESHKSICFVYDEKLVELTSEGVTIVVGSGKPLPVYGRGMYFSHDTEVVLTDLIISTAFTLEFIVRPDEATGQLLSVSLPDDTSKLSFYLTLASLNLSVDDQDFQVETVWEKNWYNLAVVATIQSIQFYINGINVGMQFTLDTIFIDALENAHVVGGQYTGMIYKLCIH